MATAGEAIVVGGARRGLLASARAAAVVHPGPSLLVSAVAVVAGGIAGGGLPPGGVALRLVLIMLPAQFAIGAVNDLADQNADRLAKPAKPLVCGAVRPATALAVAVGCVAVSMVTAALSGLTVLLVAACGLGAGLAYDLGAKRSPLSVLAWWAGFAALPLGAYAVAGALSAPLLWTIPLAGLLALTLLCANAIPDLDGDRAAGVDSIPVRLGDRGSRRCGLAATWLTAVLVAALMRPLGQAPLPLLGAAGVFAAVASVALGVDRVRRPFPWLAGAAAVVAVAWFATLPR